MTTRELRRIIRTLLCTGGAFADILEEIRRLPPRKAVSPLFALFLDRDELVRWRAISAMGVVAARMADRLGMEPARVVMRRLMWSLNDESGGIGWGAPEAMGDIMARHARLADEYQHILTSYLHPDGNYLEHPMLQRGVLWGAGRLAEARPGVVRESAACLFPFMESSDAHHRGLAALATARSGIPLPAPIHARLSRDADLFRYYRDGAIRDLPVSRSLNPMAPDRVFRH